MVDFTFSFFLQPYSWDKINCYEKLFDLIGHTFDRYV